MNEFELTDEEKAANQAAFEAWRDDLPTEKWLIVLQRATSALGHPATLNAEGPIGIDEEIYDTEELEQAMHDEFLRMYIQREVFDVLCADGLIRPDHVDESGEVVYVATEA